MSRIALVCDSTADLPEGDIRALGVTIVPLNVHFGDEVLRDHVDISPAKYLERLQGSGIMPSTSQPSPAAFTEVYDRVGADADAILVVCLSSKLSGAFQSARLGIADARISAPVHVVDSLSASTGLGLQVRRARELIDSGMAATEITATLEHETSRYQLIFFADTLEYLQRGGRIGRAGAMVGSLLKVKPILGCKDGVVVPIERTRTRSRAIDGLIEIATASTTAARIGILHDGQHPADLDRVRAAVHDLVPDGELYVNLYGPIVATHVGPGALGVCVFRDAVASQIG